MKQEQFQDVQNAHKPERSERKKSEKEIRERPTVTDEDRQKQTEIDRNRQNQYNIQSLFCPLTVIG